MKMNQTSRFLVGAIVVLFLASCAGTATQESTGEYIDDTVLTTKVKTSLLNDPAVSGLSVNVESYKGVVQLSGFVKTAAERARAVEVVSKVAGVKQVKNDILVR